MLTIEAGFDIADLGGIELAIVETGGNSFSVDVSAGLFFLSTDAAAAEGDLADLVTGYRSLLGEIVTQLNAGTGSGTWSAALDDETERVAFTHVGGAVTAVSISPVVNGAIVGLSGALSGALAHECQLAPLYWLASYVGFWSSWSGEYEGGEDVAWDVEAHDGSPGGQARETAASYLDFTLPSEPVAKVGNYPRLSVGTPWTWRELWAHSRNVEPIAMRDEDEVYFLLMRAEGTKFRPRALGSNYIARWDLELKTRVLARGV